MIQIELTNGSTHKNIESFEDWFEDKTYFVFYWRDGTEIIIKKENVFFIVVNR